MTLNILEEKRKLLKISIKKVATDTQLSYSTTYRIFNNIIQKPSLSDLKTIGNYLSINIPSLIQFYGYSPLSETALIPILEWNQILSFQSILSNNDLPILNNNDSMNTHYEANFATRIPFNCFRPLLFKNNLIVCHSQSLPTNHSLVLGLNLKENSLDIYEYKIKHKKIYLKSINPNNDHQIVAFNKKTHNLFVIKEIQYEK